jgi:hypothetical protein
MTTAERKDNQNEILKPDKIDEIEFEAMLAKEKPSYAPIPIPIRVRINDIYLGAIYFDESVELLEETLNGSGIYPISIYDCECDTIEHNSYIYLIVEHTEKYIIWKQFYHYQSLCEFSYDPDEKKYYVIKYRKTVEEHVTEKTELENVHKGIFDIYKTPFIFDKTQYIQAIKDLAILYKELDKQREEKTKIIDEKRKQLK